MRLHLLGVRGSTPAPGPNFVRYGGHTSCVAVAHDGASAPSLVLDAGTGIRSLTAMTDRVFRGSILLSHLHWDHVQGIPFCQALDQQESSVDIYAPAQSGLSGYDLMARFMSPPTFPIFPDGMRGTWNFRTIDAGEHQVEGFQVTAADVVHKGGRTLGFRISDGVSSIAYVPDHGPVPDPGDDVVDLIAGVDVLLHDAQFLESERQIADDYGHATIDDAIRLATDASVKKLVLFHHSPNRTDAELDATATQLRSPMPTVLAYEGMTISIPGQRGPA